MESFVDRPEEQNFTCINIFSSQIISDTEDLWQKHKEKKINNKIK